GRLRIKLSSFASRSMTGCRNFRKASFTKDLSENEGGSKCSHGQRMASAETAAKKERKNSFLFATAGCAQNKGAAQWQRRFQKRSAAAPARLRERLVNALHRHYRKQVASAILIKAVSGAQAKHASHSSLVSRPLYATEL